MKDNWLGIANRHALVVFLLSFAVITFGTVGYVLVMDMAVLDALYMTVITLATVGFSEVKPLDQSGRVFTILLILMGAGVVAYNISYFSQLLLDGNLLEAYRRRRLRKNLDQLRNHYVICGYGQMGQIIVEELLRYGLPVVVLEKDETLLPRLRERGILHLAGDATEEENLIEAGIQRARGLVSVVSKDPDNVFIVLTARDLSKDLLIFARSATPGTEKRLIKAGANRVVSPFAIGATRIAHNIVRPAVTDFLELALSAEGMELSMEEIAIPETAALVGKKLMDSGIRGQFNLIVVAIKRENGSMIYNPSPQEIIQAQDTLITIGPQANLARFSTDLVGCP